LVVLQTVLMMTVGLHRAQSGINVGFAEDPDLERKIRRHGNLAENAALFLAALTVLELVGAATTVVAGLGLVFVAARLAHAAAFSSLAGSHGRDGRKAFLLLRGVGAFGTLATSIGLGGYLLWHLLRLAA
ncbi:MAG: MAPEG family protein, partial [Pseudomonadota bacterium]